MRMKTEAEIESKARELWRDYQAKKLDPESEGLEMARVYAALECLRWVQGKRG